MNITLWTLQILTAIVFIYSGVNKSIHTEKELVAIGQTGVEGFSLVTIRFIAICEFLGAFGLILPLMLDILPVLTPISAICLAAIMVPAAVIHFRRVEYKNVLTNCIVFVMCLTIAFGRIFIAV